MSKPQIVRADEEWQAICDNYADENRRFFSENATLRDSLVKSSGELTDKCTEIGRLRAEKAELVKATLAVLQFDWDGERGAVAAIENLRAALAKANERKGK